MGMTIFKIKWHLLSIIKKALYKIAFGSHFQMGGYNLPEQFPRLPGERCYDPGGGELLL